MSIATASFVEPSNSDLQRHAAINQTPEVFTSIYGGETNIAIWQRNLTNELIFASKHAVQKLPTLKASCVITPSDVYTTTHKILGSTDPAKILAKDIAELVDMFCCLFDLTHAGLRLTTLSHAMCPRFHVDKVPCRLVTTYTGSATEWLPHSLVDRSKLGAGSQGKSDEESGLLKKNSDIQQLKQGDVALLKGEIWDDNAGAGLVHRSPSMPDNSNRLLLTLDLIND